MQLLPHLCVAASRWPTAIHRRHQATRPWPLTRFHGRTLSFFHEVRVARRLDALLVHRSAPLLILVTQFMLP